MADNFAGFVIHRQSAPESRDWLAKLMGTTALWQSTDQTSAHAATGAGSRRRVREFRVSSDTFSELRVGEAVIYTTLGPPPTICHVRAVQLSPCGTLLRIASAERSSCEISVHPAAQLPAPSSANDGSAAPARSADLSTVAPPPHHESANGEAPRDEVAPQHRSDPAQSFDDA